MAKKYIIYVDGIDLATYAKVTQNEVGRYYRNPSTLAYYTPKLSDFDNATPPSGYKVYTGGSHASYKTNLNRDPIDYSFIAGSKITANFDVKIISTNPSDGSWIKAQIVGTNYMIGFVHCYGGSVGKYPAVGSIIKAGQVICYVAPKSVTTFAPHLHIDEWAVQDAHIRDLILYGDFKTMADNTLAFNIGDKMKFEENTKLREAFILDDKYFRRAIVVQKGATGLVQSVEILNQDFYWYLLSFGNASGYCAVKNKAGNIWVSKVANAITNTDGSAYSPVDNTKVDALTKENGELKGQITTLTNEKIKLQGDLQTCLSSNKVLGDYKTEELQANINVRVRNEENKLG